MTLAETEELSRSTTQKALHDLRQHLAEHPSVANRFMDGLREAGKKDEAQLTSRFLDGDYPGVPYTVEKKETALGAWQTLGGVWSSGIAVVVALAVGGGLLVYASSQEGEGVQDL